MTRDDVIRWAQQAGIPIDDDGSLSDWLRWETMAAFAEAAIAEAVAAEREACAQVGMLTAINGIAVAASIRARGEQ